MKSEPQKEHQWLQQLVGEWEYEHDIPAGPKQPAAKLKGVESVRSLGGLWVLGEGRGPMPDGGEAVTMLTLGYDPEKKRFVGTWIGSMMNFLWVYDGELDPTGKVLTLNAEGPDMEGTDQMAQYRDVIEFEGPDCRFLTSHLLGEDGKWQQFMRAEYRRKG
jgi:hypothetical protein